MLWPGTPVEHLSGFQPSFCPRRGCPEHVRLAPGFRFERHGFYSTRRRWRIPRFRCRACGKQFNERSGTLLNHAQYPSDVIALVVLWRLR